MAGAGFIGLGASGGMGAPNGTAASEYGLDPGLTYLNTASLGLTPRAILDVVLKTWSDLERNPVRNGYDLAEGSALAAADKARTSLGSLIGCDADELLITRSTTDAMNSAALGIDLKRGDRVLTTDVEHEGGRAAWHHLQKRIGIELDLVKIAPEDHNVAWIVERLDAAMTKKTKVLSISHVVSSTGLRLPIKEIAALARSRGIISIVDGAQAFGGIPVNVRDLGCDAYAAPGHKWLLGPKGTGFLYISKAAAEKIRPVERDEGSHYVAGSTGMGAIPIVAGFGAAAEALMKRGVADTEKKILAMRDLAYELLLKVPKIKVVSSSPGPLATALVSFRLPGEVQSRAFLTAMVRKHKLVLKRLPDDTFNGMRISPHIFNTEAEIDFAVKAIAAEL